MPHPVDHLVYAVPDLAAGVEDFARRTGIEPVPGGRHPGRGTANYLVGLGPDRYLEIIGPDPAAELAPDLFGLDRLTAPSLVSWAARTTELDAAVELARRSGYEPGEVAGMSRQNGDSTLRWRLTTTAGIRPFLIDWGSTTHPAGGLPTVELLEFVVLAAAPAAVVADLAALDVTVPVEPAAADGLRAQLGTPRGPLTLQT